MNNNELINYLNDKMNISYQLDDIKREENENNLYLNQIDLKDNEMKYLNLIIMNIMNKSIDLQSFKDENKILYFISDESEMNEIDRFISQMNDNDFIYYNDSESYDFGFIGLINHLKSIPIK